MQSTLDRRPPPTLAEVCRKVHEISTIPHIAMRVVEVANDPDSGAQQIKEIMESDASLSTRVLRCVNSSGYALRSKISNLQQAISYLGVKQIRNLAMAAGVGSIFKKDERIGPYDRKSLWRHFVSVGVCARLIAMRLRFQDFEDTFLAGLLHDIGIILADQYEHEAFTRVLQSLREEADLPTIEHECLGFDHTRLGEAVAKTWKFPNGVIDTIRYHHDSIAYDGQYRTTVQCVETANFICSAKGNSSVGMHLVKFPRPAILALGLGKDDLVVLATDLDRELAGNSVLLQI